MQEQNVTAFLTAKSKFFSDEHLAIIRTQLDKIDDKKFLTINTLPYKDPTTALILAILLSGIDRMYLGQVGLGILKLLTCGGCGVWWIIDMITVSKRTKEMNFQKFTQLAN